MSNRIYTLYIKTHNVTGLKYLGKCENTDVYQYKGPGRCWDRHIKKHGHDVNTEILLETTSQEEMIETGIYNLIILYQCYYRKIKLIKYLVLNIID